MRALLLVVVAAGVGAAASACQPPPTACAVTWQGPAGGDWSTAASWSTGAVPTAGDRACTPAGSSVQITGPATAASVDVQGSLTVLAGGSLQLPGTTVGSTVHHLDLAGDLLVTGSATLTELTWHGGAIHGGGQVSAGGGGAVDLSGPLTVDQGAHLVLAGATSWSGGTLTVCDATPVVVQAAVTVTGPASATTSGCATPAGSVQTTAGGQVAVASTGALTVGLPWTNDGAVAVADGGTAVVAASLSQTTGTIELGGPGAVLQAGDGTGTLDLGGRITGTGQLAGSLTGAAHLAPGPAATSGSTGVITVTGSLGGTPTLELDLAGTTPGSQHDQVAVTGTATVSSATVGVSYAGGYVPPPGSAFTVLTAGSLSGAPGTLTTPQGTGAGLRPTVSATALVLTANQCDPVRFHPGAELRDQDLHGLDLTGCDLTGADLAGANLQGTTLVGASLHNASGWQTDLRGADVTSADLRGLLEAPSPDLTGVVWGATSCPDGVSSDAAGGSCTAHLTGKTFVVNADPSIDYPDNNPGDGVCSIGVVPATCTLRAAVMEANASPAPDTIVTTQTSAGLNVTANDDDLGVVGDLDVSSSMSFSGVAVSASVRLLDVHFPSSVRITGGSWRTGTNAPGGLVRNDGNLSLDQTALVKYQNGDSLWSDGNLDVNDTTVWVNATGGSGVTVAGGTARLTHVSVAAPGSALMVTGGQAVVDNTVLSTSPGTPTCTGTVTSAGHNLARDATCGLDQPSDLPGQPPKLDTNQLSLVPFPGSPAVDHGTAPCGTPTDGDGDGVVTCDIGAAETGTWQPLTMTVDDTGDGADASPGDGICATTGGTCTLRAALDEANASFGPDAIDLPASGAAINPSAGFTLRSPLTLTGHGNPIHWPGSAGFSFQAPATASDLRLVSSSTLGYVPLVTSTVDLTLERTTVAAGAGVTISNSGMLTLDRSTVTAPGEPALASNGSQAFVQATETLFSGKAGTNASVMSINGGTLSLDRSTVVANLGTAIATDATGRSYLSSSVVSAPTGTAACVGTIHSSGWNTAPDGTCDPTGPGDAQESPVPLSPGVASPTGDRTLYVPLAHSSLIDSGRPGCDGNDALGHPVGVDGNGDGLAGCDRGAVERSVVTSGTFTVTSTGSGVDANPGDGVCETATAGECTLFAAVTEANLTNGPSQVVLPAGSYTLPSCPVPNSDPTNPVLWGDVTLTGPATLVGICSSTPYVTTMGPVTTRLDHITISGSGTNVQAGASTTTLDSVTTSGFPGVTSSATASLLVHQSSLQSASTLGPTTVSGSTVTSFNAQGATTIDAGSTVTSVWAQGPLTVANSALQTTDVSGPTTITATSIRTGTLTVHPGASVTIRSTTISQQVGTGTAGIGLNVLGGTVDVIDSTIADQRVNAIATTAGASVTLTGSIIAAPGTRSWTPAPVGCAGTIASGGGNIVWDTSCGLGGPADLNGTDPLVVPFLIGTSTEPYYVPADGSPAVDSGSATCSATDQRGVARPSDGDGDGTAACDRGAIELHDAGPTSFVVTSTADEADDNPGDGICHSAIAGQCTLRAAITEGALRPGPDTVTLTTGTYTPSVGLATTGALSLAGQGSTLAFKDVDLLHLYANRTSSITGLTVSQATGYAGTIGNAIDNRAGTLLLDQTDNLKGAKVANAGAMTFTNVPATSAAVANSGTFTSTAGPLATVTTTLTVTNTGTFTGSGGAVTLTNSGTANLDHTAGPVVNSAGGTAHLDRVMVGLAANGGVDNAGTMTMVDTTVGRNSKFNVRNTGSLQVTNSVIADQGTGSNCIGTVTSLGWNLASDSSCGLTGTADVQGQHAGLVNRSASGSPVVLQPTTGSPAIDSGKPGCSGTDALGRPRPTDGDGDGTAGCERGAIELTAWNPLSMTVTSTADSPDANPGDGVCLATAGGCTLRAAVMEANASTGPDTIDLAANTTYSPSRGGQDEMAVTGDLDIATGLTLHGHGSTVKALFSDRLIQVFAPAPVTIDNLTLTLGANVLGSALLNQGGNVTLDHVTATANAAGIDNLFGTITVVDSAITANNGAGIIANDDVTVTRSLIDGNTNHGIEAWGAGTQVTITDSTVSGTKVVSTTVPGYGVGIYAGTGAAVSLSRSTVANNQRSAVQQAGAATITVTGSILGLQNGYADCTGTIASGGWNLVADSTCTAFTATGDVQGTDPLLGALADNGGPTKTFLPQAGSAAIGTGQPGCTGTDQRGIARPQGGACDKGAVEQ